MMLENSVGEVKSLAKSFRNAFRGVVFCIKNERNMRIHLTASVYVLAFSPFFGLSAAEYVGLVTAICLVLFAETVNTAIEAVVDMHTQWYDHIARIAKDVAAGSVLICAVFAVVIGCILFLKPAILVYIIRFLLVNPLLGGLFLVSLPAAALFIFGWPPRTRR